MISYFASTMAINIGKYVLIAAIAAGAYWFVWDTGRDYERTRWEAATAVELDRQVEITRASSEASRAAAKRLLKSEDIRSELVWRLQNEARNSATAGAACLDARSVMRLNALGGPAKTD